MTLTNALAWIGQTLDQALPNDELAALVFLFGYLAAALMLGSVALDALRRRVGR
jgi:hypothetical protein